MLTFSAFPDLMWQQRSKIENLFHFPSSFAILMFLLSSLLCKHEAFYLLSPTSTRRKNRFGIRCWNLGWGGETWPLSRHGSTLQGDGNQELNIGAALCTHFAWKGAARLERPWLIGKEGKHKEARTNANFEKVAPLQHLLCLISHLNPFSYHMVLWEQACNSSHICFNCCWLSSPFGICTKGG